MRYDAARSESGPGTRSALKTTSPANHMSDAIARIFDSGSADETQALAQRLGALLRGGDVLALSGGLGAGKTCFVQGLARGLGVGSDERVHSPTFTLAHEHAGLQAGLVHIDLYRLED